MARSRNRKTEQFSKDEAGNRKDIDETGEKLIPKWVKTAGALAGIIVALLGAFVGIYQVAISLKQIDVNIEKERRGSDEAKAKEAEENRKKAEVEAQQSLAEAASRIQLRQTDLDVKNAEVTKEEIAKQTLLTGIEKEIRIKRLDQEFKVEDEKQARINTEGVKLNDTLLDVFKADGSLPGLARLTEYATPEDKRLGSILTPLVAKLDEVKNPAEVSIIFQLFERAGSRALSSVIDSNRNALERLKATTKKLALVQFDQEREVELNFSAPTTERKIYLIPLFEKASGTVMSTQDSDRGLAELQLAYIEETWEQIISSLQGGRMRYRDLKAIPETVGVSRESLEKIKLPVGGEGVSDLRRDLSLQLSILRQSKRSLSRLLKQTRDFVDLSGAELSGIRLLPSEYGFISFSEAFVLGADFSAAHLDEKTLESLREAYVGREQRVGGNVNPLIRLSPEQWDFLGSGRSSGGR